MRYFLVANIGPFAYESAKAFGTMFGCPMQDFAFHSINHLHGRRKLWIINSAFEAKKLEHCIHLNTPAELSTRPQFVRHASLYFLPSTLAKWNICHTVLDQRPNQVIVTFPFPFHQGFSAGPTSGSGNQLRRRALDFTHL